MKKKITILKNFNLKGKKKKCNILKNNDDKFLLFILLHVILTIVMLWWLLLRENYCKPPKILLIQHLQTFITTFHCLYKNDNSLWKGERFSIFFPSYNTPSIYLPWLIIIRRMWMNLPLFIGQPLVIAPP